MEPTVLSPECEGLHVAAVERVLTEFKTECHPQMFYAPYSKYKCYGLYFRIIQCKLEHLVLSAELVTYFDWFLAYLVIFAFSPSIFTLILAS